MTGNIRTTLAIGDPRSCPVAEVSADAGASIRDTVRASVATDDGRVAEEFSLPAESAIETSAAEQVFSTDSTAVYRFERERDTGCVCELIERTGSPVSKLIARDGKLDVTFYAPTIDEVTAVVAELTDAFDDVQVRQLSRSGGDAADDLVLVDRSALTARQREVLETCFEMGYFDHPRRANAEEIAEAMGISSSTLREHLVVAQRKLLEALLSG